MRGPLPVRPGGREFPHQRDRRRLWKGAGGDQAVAPRWLLAGEDAGVSPGPLVGQQGTGWPGSLPLSNCPVPARRVGRGHHEQQGALRAAPLPSAPAGDPNGLRGVEPAVTTTTMRLTPGGGAGETLHRPELEPIFTELARQWAASGRLVPGRVDAEWTVLARPPAPYSWFAGHGSPPPDAAYGDEPGARQHGQGTRARRGGDPCWSP